MSQPAILTTRRLARLHTHVQPGTLAPCRRQPFHTLPSRLLAPADPPPPARPAPQPPNPLAPPPPSRVIAPARIRPGFVPQPIGAPIGHPDPPHAADDHFAAEGAGETYLERNLARRRVLQKRIDKPWVRDLRNMDANRGKFYVANQRMYKADAALYFPNLRGRSLARKAAETTSVLREKLSVVTVYQRLWAEQQTRSFVGFVSGADVREVVEGSGGAAQFVEINFEDTWMASSLVWMFQWNLRRQIKRELWDRYFILRGIPVNIKESLAMMNDKIGYVFLVDEQCRIRWSACADAWPEEKDALIRSLKRLIEERKRKP
jgi:ATPase complex subunit ATP10